MRQYWVVKTIINNKEHRLCSFNHFLEWKVDPSYTNYKTAVFETKEDAINVGLNTPRPDGYGLAFFEVWADDETPNYEHKQDFQEAVNEIMAWRNRRPKHGDLF